jgi:predicted DCC family thiol-disulfide oxidoreductase YuxK|tara:strand:- start:1706 stop:2107 length:402 start_codon:yes stop_codon:yes gene_type:complete
MYSKSYKNIIFYDDNCVLCNHSIQFLIKKDLQNQFVFAPLQGKLAKKSIDLIYIKKLDSFVVLSNGNSYVKGKAIKFIIQNLKTLSFYKWVLFIPNSILDLVYSFIGKIRYKVFGKSKNCLYLNKKIKNRFII